MSPGPEIVDIGGVTFESDLLGVIGEIQSRWPELRVQFIDPAKAEPGDAPWRIVEDCKDGFTRMVMSVWELDKRVIDRLFAADMHNPDFLKNLDDINAAVRKDQQRRFRDEMDEVKEIVKFVAESPKGRVTAPTADGGVFLFDDTSPGKRVK